jgi:hypothetical protein
MAFAYTFLGQNCGFNEGRMYLTLQVLYDGQDVGGSQNGEVLVTVATDADPETIRAAMSAAVLADAADRGYTLAASDLTLPAVQKG